MGSTKVSKRGRRAGVVCFGMRHAPVKALGRYLLPAQSGIYLTMHDANQFNKGVDRISKHTCMLYVSMQKDASLMLRRAPLHG